MTPEQRARELIDEQRRAAGWVIQGRDGMNLQANQGVAFREVNMGDGRADYLRVSSRA
jgi:type I restriction enzyme R subunit